MDYDYFVSKSTVALNRDKYTQLGSSELFVVANGHLRIVTDSYLDEQLFSSKKNDKGEARNLFLRRLILRFTNYFNNMVSLMPYILNKNATNEEWLSFSSDLVDILDIINDIKSNPGNLMTASSFFASFGSGNFRKTLKNEIFPSYLNIINWDLDNKLGFFYLNSLYEQNDSWVKYLYELISKKHGINEFIKNREIIKLLKDRIGGL